MHKHGMKVLALLATAGLLVGCTSRVDDESALSAPDTRSVVKGGHARIAIQTDVDFLDPARANITASRQVFLAICERLYEVQTDGSFAPQLAAADPEVSADGLTVTIPLREGVVFNDGTPFNAEAVKANLDRARTWDRSLRTIAKNLIKSVDVVDVYTVQLTLNHKYSPITAELGDYTGLMASPTALKASGDNFTNSPVCVGPFEYTSRAPGDNVVVTKSDRYYDKAAVNLDTITFKVVTDPNARAANVESGDLDIARVVEPVYTRLKNATNVRPIKVPGEGYLGITFNVGNVSGVGKPTGEADNVMAQHPELREAFASALDRQALSKVTTNGEVPAGCSPIPESSVYALGLDCPEPEIDKAKQLVADSGVATPIRLKLNVSNAADSLKTAQVIQAMVKEVGFELEIVPGDYIANISTGQSGNFELLQVGWAGRSDPTGNILFKTGDANNYAGYSNPEADALIEAASQTLDIDERKALYRKAVETLSADNVFIYLAELAFFFAADKDFIVPEILGDLTMKVKTAGFTSAQ